MSFAAAYRRIKFIPALPGEETYDEQTRLAHFHLNLKSELEAFKQALFEGLGLDPEKIIFMVKPLPDGHYEISWARPELTIYDVKQAFQEDSAIKDELLNGFLLQQYGMIPETREKHQGHYF